MKTKSFNYFRNAFALIGFFIIACSVATTDEPTVEPEPPVQSNNGKYQIEQWQTFPGHFLVLNTATGSTKTYFLNNATGNFEEQKWSFTFTH
tara:strand:- start:210 stop:485 length:276 start_codon:yes stop_codon:yes gene_type:complete